MSPPAFGGESDIEKINQTQIFDFSQSRYSDKKVEHVLYPVADIVDNWWNANEMEKPEYEALGADMREGGPARVDAILCTHLNKFKPDAKSLTLVVIDGAQRLSWARELKWDHVKVDIDDSIPDEATARTITYLKSRERGKLNPFKEASLFKWFIEKLGFSREKVAQNFHIDPSTVSKRVALLGLDEGVKEKALKETSKGMTVSHLEPIATLSPELQKKALGAIEQKTRWERGTVTVRSVEETVKEIKRQDEREKKFINAVKLAKVPKCPTCGKEPKLSRTELPWVECLSGNYNHEWNLSTGKLRYPPARTKPIPTSTRTKTKEFPNYVRTTHTADEFFVAAAGLMKAVVPKFDVITDATIRGKVDGKDAEFRVDEWAGSGTCVIAAEGFGADELNLTVEPKKYGAESLKQFKAVLTGRTLKNEKDAKELETTALKFLDKYGKKKPK